MWQPRTPNLFEDSKQASARVGPTLEEYLSDEKRTRWIRQHDKWMAERGFRKFFGTDREGHIISWYERSGC